MKTYRIGVLGCTGMVGQRFISLLSEHPWFRLTALAASPRSAGKSYGEAVEGRWHINGAVPQEVSAMPVLDAVKDMSVIAGACDFVFCAVDMPKNEVRMLEEAYARLECPVISNNSAHRQSVDVPMIIPEVNPEHIDVIPSQRARLGTRRGFIAVKSNCSLQSYVPALHPLLEYGLCRVVACTYQAVSGAGKRLSDMPEIDDNIIPFIDGEERKSEIEPLRIWGSVQTGGILPSSGPLITTQCFRVPVSDGHMAAVFADFDYPITVKDACSLMAEYRGEPQRLALPSAPKQFIHVFDEPDRPQTALDRDLENGMAISVGRVREDSMFSLKFVCLSHNTLRGAAGGGVLLAELLCAKGYL